MKASGVMTILLVVIAGCVRPAFGADAPHPAGIALLNSGVDVRRAQAMSNCLVSSVTRQNREIKFIAAQQAKDALFPMAEQSVASFDPAQAAVLLSNPAIQEKAREIQLRYLVFLTEAHGSAHMNGPFICGGGYGGAGCLGAARIARETTVHAVVWDLERGRQSDLSTAAYAHDLLVGFVLPLWIPGGLPTKTQACHAMAQKLVQMVREPETPTG